MNLSYSMIRLVKYCAAIEEVVVSCLGHNYHGGKVCYRS